MTLTREQFTPAKPTLAPPPAAAPTANRLHALDQFRGYTVFGMFVVNFLGGRQNVPPTLHHHHTYLSYADTIMPQFLFAVGMAYRLTFLRRQARDGTRAAIYHALTRGLALVLLGVIVHHLGRGISNWAAMSDGGIWKALGDGLKREVFQALTHIGVTSLWVLPVIGLGVWPRVLFALGSGLLFLGLSLQWQPGWWSYYAWVNTPPNGIDGGPLGFLTWAIPLIAGSLVCDAFLVDGEPGKFRTDPPWVKVLSWGVALIFLGYALSCLNRVTPPNGPIEHWREILVEPPFVPPTDPATKNVWTMSQRSGSVTYLTCAAGISVLVFLLFWVLCDVAKWTWSVFDTFGQNALIGYVLHDLVSDTLKPFLPRDAPLWYCVAATGLFLFVLWLCLRHLEKHRLFLRL